MLRLHLGYLRLLSVLFAVVFGLCIALVALTTTPQLAAAAQAVTATPAATPLPINFDQLKAKVDALVQGYMTQDTIVACSFAVVYPDPATGDLQTHFTTYGTLSKESKTPISPATMYEMGSLSKLFAADLLAKFVQDGLMQLDDPVQKYLPADVHVPTFNGQVITLRDLATHTSGLPRNLGGGLGVTSVNGVMTTGYMTDKEVYKFLNTYKLTYAPGTKWAYSNLGFGLLGMAEEKVGKDTFEHLILKWIATPLGLKDTRAVVLPAEKPVLAEGYNAKNMKAAPFASSGELISAGGLRASIQDLAAYLAANIDPSTTKIASILQATQEQAANGPNPNVTQALGWGIAAPGTPTEEFTKAGSTTGFSSYIAFSKNTRSGFVIACDGHDVSKVLAGPLSKVLGQTESSLDDNE